MTTKTFSHFLTTLFFIGFSLGCGTSSQSVAKSERSVNYAGMSTLADALRVQSGLQVVGSANTTKVTVRGVNSSRSKVSNTYVQSSTGAGATQQETTVLTDVEPLFVVDNTIVGNTYDAAARSVNVQDIVSIKVLKSYAETNAYGESGKNGVVLITTKLMEANQK